MCPNHRGILPYMTLIRGCADGHDMFLICPKNHHFIFVSFLYFFYDSSCRKDQFTLLNLKFGT